VDVLSPAKLLVILVVALVVLGPEKLPKVARQVGSLWSDFRAFRQRLESGVRETFPDLPSTETISQAVRSPMAFLDNLSDVHGAENAAAAGAETSAGTATGEGVQPESATNRPAGSVRATEEPPSIAGVSIGDPGGVVHQIRAAGHVVPDDPGLN